MVTPKSISTVICDAGPLIHLDELTCLDLLNDFESVLIPKQVSQEVLQIRPSVFEKTEVIITQVEVEILSTPDFQALIHNFTLHHGEQAALSLMKQYPNAILLTDDATARMVAALLGYSVHGTIGILLRAIRRQQRSAKDILNTLKQIPRSSSLHIRNSLLDEIIENVQQEYLPD